MNVIRGNTTGSITMSGCSAGLGVTSNACFWTVTASSVLTSTLDFLGFSLNSLTLWPWQGRRFY